MRCAPRFLSVAAAAVVVVSTATACSGGSADDASTSEAALSRWSSLMGTALLDEEHGQGGAGGEGAGGAGLGSVPAGAWDLLVACNGADGWSFRVESGPDGGDTLARSDVPCGATERLSVTVPESGGLTVRAHPLRTAPEAVRRGDVPVHWYVAVVPEGFEPESRSYELG
ncbi:hypothetical protein QUG92_13250 [Curtobacterium sp. RHCKG23]|uniref:Secreted protein n=1 Tax=Curtobacterium citri TaxID=3055139 RepID=A0ABT7T911_9MICO|nr:hypothetical protein [Curtobacterium citri]MDM7886073.1 hypothetical protein [Curtobacterium citri]